MDPTPRLGAAVLAAAVAIVTMAGDAEADPGRRRFRVPSGGAIVTYRVQGGGLDAERAELTVRPNGTATYLFGPPLGATTQVRARLAESELAGLRAKLDATDFQRLPERLPSDGAAASDVDEALTVRRGWRTKTVHTRPIGVREPIELTVLKRALAGIARRLRAAVEGGARAEVEIDYEWTCGRSGARERLTVDRAGRATLELGSVIGSGARVEEQLDAEEHRELLDALAGADVFALPDRFASRIAVFGVPEERVSVRGPDRAKSVATRPCGVVETAGFGELKRALAAIASRLRRRAPDAIVARGD